MLTGRRARGWCRQRCRGIGGCLLLPVAPFPAGSPVLRLVLWGCLGSPGPFMAPQSPHNKHLRACNFSNLPVEASCNIVVRPAALPQFLPILGSGKSRGGWAAVLLANTDHRWLE